MKKYFFYFSILVTSLLFSLEVGSEVANFSLKDQEGFSHTLLSHRKKFVILYFFPGKFQPRIQTNLRKLDEKFIDSFSKNVVIYGVSSNSVKKNSILYNKAKISFDILSDAGEEVISKYTNRRYFFLKNTIVIIGPDGRFFKAFNGLEQLLKAEKIINYIINYRK